jgi:hypothetical protein
MPHGTCTLLCRPKFATIHATCAHMMTHGTRSHADLPDTRHTPHAACAYYGACHLHIRTRVCHMTHATWHMTSAHAHVTCTHISHMHMLLMAHGTCQAHTHTRSHGTPTHSCARAHTLTCCSHGTPTHSCARALTLTRHMLLTWHTHALNMRTWHTRT